MSDLEKQLDKFREHESQFIDGAVEYEDFNISYGHQVRDAKLAGIFPRKYDLRAEAAVTPVKSQFSSNCWIFATMGELETFMLKNKYISQGDYETDLSEMHMTYAIFDMHNDNNEGVKVSIQKDTKGNDYYAYGGNGYLAASYLTRSKGIILERIDPCINKKDITASSKKLPDRAFDITQNKEVHLIVSDIVFIENPVGNRPDWDFINDVKFYLKMYGAVYISLHYDYNAYMAVDTNQKPNQFSYYSLPLKVNEKRKGHAVLIVGWDDDYKSSNFKNDPGVNGAFLIKNSHGIQKDKQGNLVKDGYFWLSYADGNMNNANCITGIKTTAYNAPMICHRHSKFGLMRGYPQNDVKWEINFSCKFSTKNEESISSVGLYCYTPCLVDLKCNIAGKDTEIVSNHKLSTAGYHTYELTKPINVNNTEYEIKVSYKSFHNIRVYAPVEYKFKNYSNITVLKDTCYIENQDITTLGEPQLGNIALHVFLTPNNTDSKELQTAWMNIDKNSLTVQDGLLFHMPTTLGHVQVEWRAEPYLRESYDTGYNKLVGQYKVNTETVIKNLTNGSVNVPICAILKIGSYEMRKVIDVPMATSKKYTFSTSKIEDGTNTIDLHGEFPINGATIKVQANGRMSTTVVSNNKWSLNKFELYDLDVQANKGWDEKYKDTKIEISVLADCGTSLSDGDVIVHPKCPYNQTSEDSFEFSSIAGLIGAIIAGGAVAGGVYYLYQKRNLELTDAAILAFGGMNNAIFNGGGFYLSIAAGCALGGFIFSGIKEMRDTNVSLDANIKIAPNFSLIDKIADNGIIEKCALTGSCENTHGFYGFLKEGNNVQIKNCSIDVTLVNNNDASCGIAGCLSGKSVVENCVVHGSFSGTLSAGIAIEIKDQCKISNCRISAKLESTEKAGGIVASMSKCVSTASIENCYSACKILTPEQTGESYGIASGLENFCVIKNCISVCSEITGKTCFRISKFASENCVAYKDMISNTAFVSANEKLLTPTECLEIPLYKDVLKWDIVNVWNLDEKFHFPSLKIKDSLYDMPFPIPSEPENGYSFNVNSMISLLGIQHYDTERVTWVLSLRIKEGTSLTGDCEYLGKNDNFYLEIGTLAHPGEYDLTLVSILYGKKFTYPIVIKIATQ